MEKIIHVGLPKTATTTLQNGLFCRHSELFYFGRPVKTKAQGEFFNSIIYDDDIYFDTQGAKDTINRLLDEANQLGKKTFLLSHEYFVYVPNRASIANRLHQLFPDGQVLMVIRNQIDILSSFYAAKGRYLDPESVPPTYRRRHVSLEDWLDHCLEKTQQTFLGATMYGDIVNYYEKVFARPVRVLLFEDFVRKKEKFIASLADILGIDPEISYDLLDEVHENPRFGEPLVRYHQMRKNFFPNLSVSRALPLLRPVIRVRTH